MLVIGERINATRKGIREAIEKKDALFIQKEAAAQVEAGADMLDVNCGMDPKNEKENIEWLLETVQEKVTVPLVIDSPNPDMLEKGIKLHRNGKPMINSITGETATRPGMEKAERILALVRQYRASVVILTLDDRGMPSSSKERLEIALKMNKLAADSGIPAEDIYFDLLVRPLSVEPLQAKEFLESIKLVKKELPGVKTVCGLSNISFGLPNRSIVNSTFLVMAIDAGLDAALIDITDKKMFSAIKTSEALLGRDEYCMNYITAFKEGKIL